MQPPSLLAFSRAPVLDSAAIDATAASLARGLGVVEQDPYVDAPAEWVEDTTGEFLWSKQVEIAESVVENRFTAVQSCHGTGKSFVSSRLAAWWIATHPVGEAFVVTTAPTGPQVSAILWREIRKAKRLADEHRPGELEGDMTQGTGPEWKINGEIVAYGRKPADHNAHAFQGIHAKYVLVILDEACGIPRQLWDAVDSIVTNKYSRVLAIGNPDDPTSHFARVCKAGSGWNKIRISAYDLPEFTGEEVPDEILPMLTGKVWVEERKKRWGEESPIYTSKVLGLFPDISDDTLIPPRLIRKAMNTDLSGNAIVIGHYAQDVARSGKDENVLCRNQDGYIRVVETWRSNDLTIGRDKLNALLGVNGHKYESSVTIDTIGVGAGLYDMVKELDIPCRAFNSSNKPYDETRFANRRAEVYWLMREGCRKGLIDLPAEGTAEQDDDLIAQLGSVKFAYDSKGRIQIEDKKEHAKRVGSSPDRADAAVMTLLPPAPAGKARGRERDATPVPDDEYGITDGLMEEVM